MQYKEHAFNYSGRDKGRRIVTQVLSGSESLALEWTFLLLHFIPGNYRPSVVLGTESKEPRKAIRGKGGKDITVSNGRITILAGRRATGGMIIEGKFLIDFVLFLYSERVVRQYYHLVI